MLNAGKCKIASFKGWLLVFLFVLPFHNDALSQYVQDAPADLVLLNGKVFEPHRLSIQSLAIAGDRIMAIDSAQIINGYIGNQTRVIDLQGKILIPGLIDSHIHAIRAGLYFGAELDWADIHTIPEALAILNARAKALPSGAWIVVAGGWTDQQFVEKRKPSLAEVEAASMDHPFYIQYLYDGFLISPSFLENKILDIPAQLLARLKVETQFDKGWEQPTGWFYGDARTVSDVFELLPQPSFEAQLKGSKEFFLELNRNAITGVLDPGGYNLSLSAYKAVQQLALNEALSLKLRYFLSAPMRGNELSDFKSMTSLEDLQKKKEFYLWNGIGENVTWGMYNNEKPSVEQQQELQEVLNWANDHQLTVTLHWNNNQSVGYLLDVIERVNARRSIQNLRWSIAHLNDASEETLLRMSSLGLGWLVQDSFYYQGERFVERRGSELAMQVPRIRFATNLGMKVAMGTDAHRVMTYRPFTALQWLISGKTAGGTVLGDPAERPDRAQALRMYTQNSAWYSFEESKRGLIQVGAKADLAVLSQDYFNVPIDKLDQTRSLLTLVNGRIVFNGLSH